MISSEVQRTLVKSPPELWAEISDPESLARHLGEFGDIRITRVHPEQKIEWEAADASGTVVIKPSGWGTKVKLTVTRELALETVAETDANIAPEPSVDEQVVVPLLEAELQRQPEPEPEPEPVAIVEAGPQPVADVEPAPEPAAIVKSEPEPEPTAEVEPEAEPAAEIEPEPTREPEPAAGPEPRRGFFARLFGRRNASASDDDPEPKREPQADSERSSAEPQSLSESPGPTNTVIDAEAPAEGEPTAAGEPPAEGEPTAGEETSTDGHPPTDGEPTAESEAAATEHAGEDVEQPVRGDIAAELAAAEEVAAEQVTAVLTSVLDRLGAAHHRPFSRS